MAPGPQSRGRLTSSGLAPFRVRRVAPDGTFAVAMLISASTGLDRELRSVS